MGKKKRADGNYSLNFIHDGKRYCVYAKKQSDLPEKKTEKIRQIEEKKAWVESHGGTFQNPSLSKYYDRFTDRRRGEVKENSLCVQRSQFLLMAKTEVNGRPLGEYKLREITVTDIYELRDSLQRIGKRPPMINQAIAHLSHVMSAAVLEGITDRNPVKGIKPLKKESDSRETTHRALTKAETLAFFRAADGGYYTNAFRFMVNTGVRFGEMGAIYPTDIDYKKSVLHIRRTITKSETGALLIGTDTKTRAGGRDIPLTPQVIDIIRNQEKQNREFFGCDAGLLFRSPESSIIIAQNFNNEIRRVCEAADVEPFTSHAFRNTFATRFMEQRPQDFKILSEILGHSDISITLNIYTHVMEDNKVAAMNDISIMTS